MSAMYFVHAAIREVFRREALPPRARWWLAAAGMRDWFAFLASRLRPHLGDRARPVLARLGARMFERRYDALTGAWPHLPPRASDPRAVALLFSALYRAYGARAGWIFGGLSGPPRGVAEMARAARIARPLAAEDRWREVTVHLGELLIVTTEDLPAELPHARKILGDLCHEAGVRYARRMMKAWRVPAEVEDAPALAIEILRTSEYLFRVNPEHWGGADAASNTGWIEGTACPWFDRPGWNGAHCGIFGQFQAGVCSELGLKYVLGKTIPKHGGTTCRIDIKPMDPKTLLRRSA
jgi:hypothetical protein